MPPLLKEEFDKECPETRQNAVIREAAEMVEFKGVLISAMIGKDVTQQDIREETTFWDSRQSGRGPVLFRKLVELVLGGDLISNPITLLLYRGPFRDVFETVYGECIFRMIVLYWLRMYLTTGNPSTSFSLLAYLSSPPSFLPCAGCSCFRHLPAACPRR